MRSKIVRFRLQGQHLSHRLPPGELLQTAGACGVQNTPPGAAALSLHARLSGLTRDAVEQALEEGKTLLQTWSLRGAPTIFPTRDAAVFNTGLLPGNSRTLQTFIIGSEQPLKELGMPVGELVRLTAEAARVVLDGRILANKWKLDQELAQHILHKLPAEQQKIWQGPSPFAENQILGEALVSFALRPVALQGVICFAPRRGNEASFVFTEQWLGSPPAALDLRQARRELLRRYLRCYGPSTPQDFAAWTGTALQQAKETWTWSKVNWWKSISKAAGPGCMQNIFRTGMLRMSRRVCAFCPLTTRICSSAIARCWRRIKSCSARSGARWAARASCC